MDKYSVILTIIVHVEANDVQEIQAMVNNGSIFTANDIRSHEINLVYRQNKKTKAFEEVTGELK